MPFSARKLAHALYCHAWRGDLSMLAVSPHSSEIHVYATNNHEEWGRKTVLRGHDRLVSGLDWAKESDLLVSVSHDRCSFVWRLEEDRVWKPHLVLTRLSRSALCVQWSPSEKKFAIGSGSKVACVCHYQQDNDW